eukprot:COSAG02_NODE_12439_length_1544_cov_2.849827_1_plen_111_part_00
MGMYGVGAAVWLAGLCAVEGLAAKGPQGQWDSAVQVSDTHRESTASYAATDTKTESRDRDRDRDAIATETDAIATERERGHTVIDTDGTGTARALWLWRHALRERHAHML